MSLRIGLIGCGNRSRAHVRGVLENKDKAKIVAVCDSAKELAEARAKELEISDSSIYTDYQELVSRSDIDAVMIVTPHHLHMPQAVAAAKSKKHVLVEKPMCNNLQEAESMIEAAEKSRVKLMVAQNQRFDPSHQGLKKLIDEGAIGKVFCARADANQHLHGILPEGHWLYFKEKAGGGVVISVAVHKLDLLRYFLGNVKRVSSFQKNTGVNSGMDCEDASVAILEFESGAIGEMASFYAAKAAPWGELVMLYGTEGDINNIGGWHIYSEKRAEWKDKRFTKLEFSGKPDYVNMVEHFLDCIINYKEPLTSGKDNLNTMKVIMGIYRSAETGKVVEV